MDTAREWILGCGSVLIFGADRTGRADALDDLVSTVPSRVLRHAATEATIARPYGTLAGLLALLTTADLDLAAGPGPRVLAAVMSQDARAVAPAAARQAALNLFRAMARTRPLLLAVDDAQWVDRYSEDVLRFVAGRVADVPLRVAATRRHDPDDLPRCRSLLPSPLLMIHIGAGAP